jgi:hypothetical protein
MVERNTTPAPPKPGAKTSSFYVWLATLVVGGLFVWLDAGGRLSRLGADAQRPQIERYVADALSQLLPVVWMGVVGWLGKAFIRGRAEVSRIKAEVFSHAALAQEAPTTAERQSDVKQ